MLQSVLFSIVFWFGDFNYRINLSNEMVRNYIYNHKMEELKRNDQLLRSKADLLSFQYFEEGEINFLPTYKYNNGTNEYDTSENARIPAWTDRILYKGMDVR